MDIYELFEQTFADMHDCYPEDIKPFRMQNGSYSKANIATDFRYFKAGFDANQGDKLRVLGYLSHKGVLSASQARAAFFAKTQTDTKCVPVYVKQSDTHKTGE